MNMKKVILFVGLMFIGLTAYGQSAEKGLSASAWGGVVLGDDVFSDLFGAGIGGNLHYTLTDSESTDFVISAGAFNLFPSSDYSDIGGESELFYRVFGNVIFQDALSEGQNISLGLGYSWAADSDADYGGIYLEGFYQFEISETISLAPGVFYVAGGDEDGDIFVGALRATFKF